MSKALDNSQIINGAPAPIDADLIRGLPADFSKSFTGNGYQKLPSGLIIQWGNFSNTTGRHTPITFPISFPNVCLSVSIALYDPTSTSHSDRFLTALSRTGATFYAYNPDPNEWIYWIAIGH